MGREKEVQWMEISVSHGHNIVQVLACQESLFEHFSSKLDFDFLVAFRWETVLSLLVVSENEAGISIDV